MMPSRALQEWQTNGRTRLNELEAIHARATGPQPGRRWETEQLNRSLFVALVAQCQKYCRSLHDEAVEVHEREANEHQADLLRNLMTQGSKLATQTPRTDRLGADFSRLGFDLVEAIKSDGPRSVEDLRLLDLLVDFRNAIGHGNETKIADLVDGGEIKATKTDYRRYRRTLERLAHTMDRVVAAKLGDLLQIPRPW